LEGVRYEVVAAVLDVPLGIISSRLSRDREVLRSLMWVRPRRGLGRQDRPHCRPALLSRCRTLRDYAPSSRI